MAVVRLNRHRFDDALASRKRRFYRWLQLHKRLPGLPEGIDHGTIDKLCREHQGWPLKRASYAQLSGWKVSGAFRLFLTGPNGEVWRLIYKDAAYTPEQIPALRGLPLVPGLPEWLIYSVPAKALASYLPRVYLCLEVVSQRQYRYVLEDLGGRYQRLTRYKGPAKRDGILHAASRLCSLHRALGDWAANIDPTQLLQFDGGFSAVLLPYARTNLESYLTHTADSSVSEVIGRWPEIAAAHDQGDWLQSQPLGTIHGDYHTGHIYLHQEVPDRIKLIDWEWTGFGRSHADLASLLKRAGPEIELQALMAFSQQDTSLSLDEHRQLYEWCQLERGLLDAAFLARQQMESRRQAAWIPRYIERSVARVLRAQEFLADGGVASGT